MPHTPRILGLITIWILTLPLRAALAQEVGAQAGLAWQIALDREGFSPGLLDGNPGAKTALATREFQKSRGLAATGTLDAATAAALLIESTPVLGHYTVTADDFAQIGPVPKDWNEKAKLARLGYESMDWVLSEKFHCTRALLARLNGGRDPSTFKPGETIIAPATALTPTISAGSSIEINLTEKVIRVLSAEGRVVGMFHCSIAAKESKRPTGAGRVVVISPNPTYKFDPKMWPDVTNVHRVLMIPPGPRNPVGLCWIGLNLPGYGMHGTPNPEMIGKTGSHGCFRLANWDALRLSKMVAAGMPVKFVY